MTYPIRSVPDNDTAWGSDLRDTIAGVNDHQTRVTALEVVAPRVTPAPYLSETWTGTNGTGWSAQWGSVLNAGTATIQLNTGRHVTATPVNSTVESTLTGIQVADGEILYRWQWVGNGGVVRVNDLRFRAADATNANSYVFGTSNGGSSISKRVGGTQTFLSSLSWSPAADVWYWVRVRFVGSTLQARWWADGTVEPVGWTLSTTDTVFTGGLVTLLTQNNSTVTGAFTTAYDDFQMWRYAETAGTTSGITTINGANGPAVTIAQGSNVTITTDTSTDTVTIGASVTGGAANDGIYLDSFTGTDEARLTSAIASQQATAGMPPIILGPRNHSFTTPRNLYSGLKLIGANYSGPKNLELSSSNFVTSRITLGGSVTSGTTSWWNSPGTDCYDIFMSDFAVAGNAGSSIHQFLDFPTTATMYACEFRSLSFNFMRGVMGRKDRVCACTQVVFSGHWTVNNLWDTQFCLGGSDSSFWMGGYINMGPSSSAAQTGTYADGDYEMIFSAMSNTNCGYIYMTALNGWRGIKITGSSGNGLFFHGGVYEGYKGNTTSLTAGPAPGSVIRIEGGSGAFYGPNVGQAMNNPDAAEGGYIHMTGGEWSIYGATFYRGLLADTVPVVYQTGGRLLVTGATRRQNETWTTRPKYSTSATGPNSTQTSFYCPDQSLVP